MPGEGRFLNSRFIVADGLRGNDDNAIINEGGSWTIVGGAKIGEGATKIAKIISTTAVVSLSVLNPVGSVNVGQNMALTGVVPGDLVIAQPVASVPLSLLWNAACYSAGVINIRAAIVGSTGSWDIAGTTWRAFAIQF
jgi:hypothetical protein